jgi:hypothetical protein
MKISDLLRRMADIVDRAEQESHIGTASPFTAANQPCDACQQAPCACDTECGTEQPDELDTIRQLGGIAPVVTIVGN